MNLFWMVESVTFGDGSGCYVENYLILVRLFRVKKSSKTSNENRTGADKNN